MQAPVQSGVKLLDGSFATSFPVNLEHRLIESGVSRGQLVTTRGTTAFGTGPGKDRGGIMWQGVHYRVMGTKFVSVASDGTVTTLGDVGGFFPVRMDYSFDRLAITSEDRLFYWDGSALVEVTDPDLGAAKDVTWIDGYFVTTDGEFVIVTELLDPTQVDPLKYGSSETDPDAVTGVEELNEELYVFNRNTIQVFRNTGSTGFPFQNVRGAAIPLGCVNAYAKCLIAGTIAFVGGGREEPIGVFVMTGGSAVRISTREIEDLMLGVDETQIELEARKFGEDDIIVLHLPEVSASLKVRTSNNAEKRLWTILHSGKFAQYRPRHAVWDGQRHIVGDVASGALGTLSLQSDEHFGEAFCWRFDIGLLYNEGSGLIVQETEIVGQFPIDEPSEVFFSVTRDGELWSNEVARRMQGARSERCIWRPNVRMPAMFGARFRGNGRVSIARANVRGEALSA